ncbi:MAG: NmrA/HSCARG family protein [Pirellula sp.]
MTRCRKILVTGATGRQGGSVARSLRSIGVSVVALTRRTDSPAAKQLRAIGCEVVGGDLSDRRSLDAAVKGCDGVFSVQSYWEKGVGMEGEVLQGRHMIAAAAEAGLSHLVQSTMATAEDVSDVPHFVSKRRVEEILAASEVPHTLLGTVYFMENMLDPKMGGAMTIPSLAGSLRKTTHLHLMSYHDIGPVAAELFLNPGEFLGKRVDIAGDCLTVEQMRHIYHDVTGRNSKWYSLPAFLLRLLAKEFSEQLRWHNEHGFRFDVVEVRKRFPALMSFREFIANHPDLRL